jgi:uncharacterized protein (TIGR04222 family)
MTMGNPWGISGPAFVWVYAALLAIPFLFRALWYATAGHSGAGSAITRPLSVYHLAYLAGGPYRTVQTVIAAMVERGQLRVSSDKRLKTTGSVPSDPLERAVGNAVNSSFASTTTTVQLKVRSSAELGALAAELESLELVVPRNRIKAVERTVLWAYFVVLAVGVARWVTGAALNRPVGLLSAGLVLAFVFLLAAFSFLKRDPRSIPTSVGKRVLDQARRESSPSSRGQRRAPEYSGLPLGAVLVGAAGAVALGGLAMHPDEALGAALMPTGMGGGGSSSGGDSGSGCSSGSSCGGGGCGGGCGG